jgi:hypothetical protein
MSRANCFIQVEYESKFYFILFYFSLHTYAHQYTCEYVSLAVVGSESECDLQKYFIL